MGFRQMNPEQPPYLATYRVGGTGAGFTGPKDTVYLLPLSVHTRTVVKNAQITVQLAAGNMEIAIYDSNFNQLRTTGVVAVANGVFAWTAGDIGLAAGRYWLAFACTVDGLANLQIYGGANSGLGKKQAIAPIPMPTQLTPIDAAVGDAFPRLAVYT